MRFQNILPHAVKLSLVVATFFFLSRCATLANNVKPPTVELASIRVADPTLSAATFVFGIRVDNPNWFRLSVYSLDYTLDMNQQQFASGELVDLGSIPSGDKKIVEVPLRIPYANLVRAIQTTAQQGKASYELKGNVLVSGVAVPFHLGGTLPLPTTLPVR